LSGLCKPDDVDTAMDSSLYQTAPTS
jgi:hypothetical protein